MEIEEKEKCTEERKRSSGIVKFAAVVFIIMCMIPLILLIMAILAHFGFDQKDFEGLVESLKYLLFFIVFGFLSYLDDKIKEKRRRLHEKMAQEEAIKRRRFGRKIQVFVGRKIRVFFMKRKK